MTKSLTPYNLGKLGFCVEDLESIDINEYVRIVNRQLKERLISSQLEINGLNIDVTTSKSVFNGDRFWFKCPRCLKKRGKLLKNPINSNIECRQCLSLIYQSQI